MPRVQHHVTYPTPSKPTQQEDQGFTEDLGHGVKLEMVKILGDTFTMGASKKEEGSSDDERPEHQVTVPDFYMGRFLVTQAQWARVAASFPQIKRKLEIRP
ncbi:SUMF1/EgtB/PvdO family nonheme iron enzyme, partial [Nodularia spumigena CS-591/12]